MDAESIGLSENLIVLGKHSGRHAFRSRLQELGYKLNEDEVNNAFYKFKDLADKKKVVSNLDIEALVNNEMGVEAKDRYKVMRIQVQCGDQQVPTATATVLDQVTEELSTVASTGTGPVDATFKAIRMLTPALPDVKLLEYTVSSVTAGIDALGEVTVRLQDVNSSRIAFGRSANTDVIVASAYAYMNAINRLANMMTSEAPTHPQFNSI
jgi:2-isopropylmalate synthase